MVLAIGSLLLIYRYFQFPASAAPPGAIQGRSGIQYIPVEEILFEVLLVSASFKFAEDIKQEDLE